MVTEYLRRGPRLGGTDGPYAVLCPLLRSQLFLLCSFTFQVTSSQDQGLPASLETWVLSGLGRGPYLEHPPTLLPSWSLLGAPAGSNWGPWRCGPGASPTPPPGSPTRRQRFPLTCWETARLSLKTCHVFSQVDTPMAKGEESL